MHCNKDYCIFRIDYFADRRLLNRTWKKNNTLPKQHYERAEAFTKFIWSFIEELTGMNQEYWFKNFLEPRICAYEKIREDHNIFMLEDNGKLYILIPNNQVNMIEKVRNEKNILPKKELKKFRFANMWSIWAKREPDMFRLFYVLKKK